MIEKLTILVMGVIGISAHQLISDVGIKSRLQDSDSEVLLRHRCKKGVFLIQLGLATEADSDDSRAPLILRICQNNLQNCRQDQFYLYSLVQQQQRTCVKSF